MSILNVLNNAEEELNKAGIETARLDAEVLLAHALGIQRVELYLQSKKELSEENKKQFRTYIDNRLKRTPVAYITGTKEFWSISIKVTPDVLIPRPETELIVEEVLKIVANKNADVEILDICTGSGCIPAALAKELPSAKITVTDISEKALDVARDNLAFAKNRTQFFTGDLFDALSFPDLIGESNFDIITANPPYIPTGDRETLAPEITEHEPQIALFGGKSGLDLIEKIIKNASLHLKSGGYLLIEIGFGQSEQIKDIAKSLGCYKNITVLKDLAGIERVFECQFYG